MAAGQHYGGINAPLSQSPNDLEALHARHILIDDEALADHQIAFAQQLLRACIGAYSEPVDLKGRT